MVGVASAVAIVWWLALLTAGSWSEGMNLVDLLGKLSAAMNSPFLFIGRDILRCLLFFTLGYGIAALVIISSRKNTRRGAEHAPPSGAMYSRL